MPSGARKPQMTSAISATGAPRAGTIREAWSTSTIPQPRMGARVRSENGRSYFKTLQSGDTLTTVKIERDRTQVEPTDDELRTVAACIGETLEALEDWEFQTRVGVTREAAMVLLDAMTSIAGRGIETA